MLGLLARRGGGRFNAAQVRQRVATAAWPRAPAQFGLHDEMAVLGSFVAGPSALWRFAGDAPINSDDHPVVSYRAPRITYAPDSRPAERLIALLRAFEVDADEVLSADTDAFTRLRLAGYWRARNRFAEAGLHVQPTSDARRMLAQVQAPLLEVLRLSPEFRPAYDPLFRLSVASADSDATAARQLLHDLVALQPARPEARQALQALSAKASAP